MSKTKAQKLDDKLSDLTDKLFDELEDIQLNLDYDIEDLEFQQAVQNHLGADALDHFVDWGEETFG